MTAFDFSTATPEQVRLEAERRQRLRDQGKPLDEPPAVTLKSEAQMDRDRMRRESELQAQIVKTYRAFGCKVYTRNTPKRVKVTPGQPDIRVFHPATRDMWEHEAKTRSGVYSEAQEEYRDLCLLVDPLSWVGGGVEAAEQTLIDRGIVEKHGDSLIATRSTTNRRHNWSKLQWP